MTQIKLIVKDILLSLILVIVMAFFSPPLALADKPPLTNNVQVSISIGEYHFTLFGYTSPKALVTFQGAGIYDQTYADSKGYFQFSNRFSPFSPHEACITAQDQFGRLSKATCLPPFPTDYNVEIGPIILPPTLSLNKGQYFVGDNVVLSGQSVPNKEVVLSFFTEDKTGIDKYIGKLNPFKIVQAYSLPKIKIRANKFGNYSIQLPSTSKTRYRFFTQVKMQKQSSDGSLFLHVKILPVWMIIINFFIFIFFFLKPHLLDILIALEILITIMFLYLHRSKKNLAIVPKGFYNFAIKLRSKLK